MYAYSNTLQRVVVFFPKGVPEWQTLPFIWHQLVRPPSTVKVPGPRDKDRLAVNLGVFTPPDGWGSVGFPHGKGISAYIKWRDPCGTKR